jgi:predicted RNA-binding protein with PUA-like domain
MWLLKTEPAAYAFEDLERQGTTAWDGVTNPVALKNLRGMKVGDLAAVYHTGGQKAVVGLAEVTRAAYPDPKRADARLVAVDLRPLRRLARPVSLAELKAHPAFAESPLLRQGRLSVVPLTVAQEKALEALAARGVK